MFFRQPILKGSGQQVGGVSIYRSEFAGHDGVEFVCYFVVGLYHFGIPKSDRLLGNAFKVAAINGGRHVAPSFTANTIYAWSEILEKSPLPENRELGVLRLRTIATKDRCCSNFPYKDNKGHYQPAVVLDFDYTILIPRKP